MFTWGQKEKIVMPIYVYKCKCGLEWESLKPIDLRLTDECKCGLKGELIVTIHAKTPLKWRVDAPR